MVVESGGYSDSKPGADGGGGRYCPGMGEAARTDPYPLLLGPTLLEKVWGGRRLESLGKVLPDAAARYGESWELADMGATSVSGAGGGAMRSRIANGGLRGRTLGDAWAEWGDGLVVGSAREKATAAERRTVEGRGNFPLLIKFLDASENLSVQVHPSPAYAAAHTGEPGVHLKTECWYILGAEAGAVIYKGVRPGVTREEFAGVARTGEAGIVDAMVALPAVVGECHNLPSGTVHALGAGVLVAEVQTPSDTTFRLYDWGRPATGGRRLHVEESLACASFPGEPGNAEMVRGMTVARCEAGQTRARLVTTEYFTVDELRPGIGDVVAIADVLGVAGGRGAAVAIVVLEGECELVDGRAFQPVALRRGDTALVPAAIVAHTLLSASVAGVRVLAARVG